MHTLATKPTLLTSKTVMHPLKNAPLVRDVKPSQGHYTHSGCKPERRRRQRNSHRWTSLSDTCKSPGVPRQHYSIADRASTHEGVEHRVEENTVARLSSSLSFFQQVQHLRSDAPTTSPGDFTLKVSSSEKGKRPRGGWCLNSW